MNYFRKFHAVFHRKKLDADMAEEMRAHLDLQTHSNRASGMSPEEAHYAARRQFGGLDQIKEVAREQRGWLWLEDFFSDLRYAVRTLIKHRGFTVAAVLTLALGIGFVTSLFTMINGVAFARLPFANPEAIVGIDVPATEFDEYAERQQSVQSLALARAAAANLRVGESVSRYSAATVSINALSVLGISPIRGRGFLPEDEQPGSPRVVLIGEAVWETEFARDVSVTGRDVEVNGEKHSVIGVMPAQFGFPRHEQLWIPRRVGERISGGDVFGRLRSGVSAAQAAEQFTALAANLTPRTSDQPTTPRPVEVVSFARRGIKDGLRIMLMALLAATFAVLLLACANVTNLVLARAVGRRRELAVRVAVGATRTRLIRQMLTESLVLAVLGAAGGLVIAGQTTQALWRYMQSEAPLTGGAPFWISFNVDGRVYVFVVAVALLATVLTGLVPALRASRVDLNTALKQGGGAGSQSSRLTRILIHVQVGFSVCLVIVAGLFVSVLLAFNTKQLAYNPAEVLTARVSLDEQRYDSPAVRQVFFERLVAQLKSTPGIDGVALTSSERLRSSPSPRIELEGARYSRDADRPSSLMEIVSPGFLGALDLTLKEGRDFSSLDNANSLPVAWVNTAFVDRFGGDGNLLGRRFRVMTSAATSQPWVTIVGVVPELGSMKAGQSTRGPVFYRPLSQEAERAMTVLIRAKPDPLRFTPALRQAVASLDPALPVFNLKTVQSIVEMERVGMNSFGSLFIVCGVGALLLASVGVYAVIAFSVRMRTREFGVRLALGADRRSIVGLVFGEGLKQVGIGLGIGLLTALVATFAMRAFLIGVAGRQFEGLVYLGAGALLILVAAVALLIPAMRAAGTNPIEALRSE
ncbi:MAG: ABC transporter permease [Opitutaceae bacterium]